MSHKHLRTVRFCHPQHNWSIAKWLRQRHHTPKIRQFDSDYSYMIVIKLIPDPISFGYRIAIFKDDVKLESFNYELLDDLTYRSRPSNPFRGPEFTKEEMAVELMTMMKNSTEELSDVSVEELIKKFNPLIKNYKIKIWDGEYLPFY